MDDNTLERLIADEITLLARLKSALEREHRALNEQDADQLTVLATEKGDLARNIDILEHKRAAHQLADTDPRWQHLLELARECERLNQINGLVVHSNQLRVREALGLLRADVATAETYSANGSASANATSRSLAQV